MDPSASTSLPSLGIIKSPAGLGISGSGSFQSHLSSGESHQRLRAGIHSFPGKEPLPYNAPSSYTLTTPNTLNPPAARLTAVLSKWLPADIGLGAHISRLLLSWPKSWFQWFFLAYCCLSVIFLPVAMFKYRERFHHLLSSPGKISILRIFHSNVSRNYDCSNLHFFAFHRSLKSTTTVDHIIYPSTA
jgi:hypothetical protein